MSMTKPTNNHLPIHITGFTLLEIMIALMIFSIGLLGLAGLQATSLEFNRNALSRTLAIQQAENMADRIRANLKTFDGTAIASYDTVTTAMPSEPTSAFNNCYYISGSAPTACTPQNLAQIDIFEWQLRNSQILPSGRGRISRPSGTYFQITVMWDEKRTGATGENCSGNALSDLECYTIQLEP